MLAAPNINPFNIVFSAGDKINTINEEINNIYNILEKKSLEIDKTGMYKRMIEKMINKGDKNEI